MLVFDYFKNTQLILQSTIINVVYYNKLQYTVIYLYMPKYTDPVVDANIYKPHLYYKHARMHTLIYNTRI